MRGAALQVLGAVAVDFAEMRQFGGEVATHPQQIPACCDRVSEHLLYVHQ